GEAALLAMVVNLGAYSTEIVRAGIQVTPKGQWEAGRGGGARPPPPPLTLLYAAKNTEQNHARVLAAWLAALPVTI
ncbi:hypothetical protein PT209_05320, partial [Klebsiella pneumoniae]|nr:hypothetical protein [Klebsiella pneumoniae]